MCFVRSLGTYQGPTLVSTMCTVTGSGGVLLLGMNPMHD